jgi:hypothetical protein
VDGTDVHPIRGTAGTARGADADRSNELLDDNESTAAESLWVDPSCSTELPWLTFQNLDCRKADRATDKAACGQLLRRQLFDTPKLFQRHFFYRTRCLRLAVRG